ncbi:hypothetical protein J7443_13460 [Tropicibacter sp. R15_0]|uniref:hypothetical protein n=1 Tax=Tropicibacter sp. R15_0 TaxID=2821101 RepID=UPI001ADAF912|nr:hypothetical protein [Tropicibacter sp. R15_0]MBO9466245.1 hypothetical protein [Tropicibacter sp. R15_0]
MSIAKMMGVTAIAGIVGLGAFAVDYSVQWHKAGEDFGTPQYIMTLYDRFGDSGGTLGLILRKSAMVLPALPDAPIGWEAYEWNEPVDEVLFSAQQHETYAKHVVPILEQIPEFQFGTVPDGDLYDAYHSDTSVYYEQGDNGIGLWVNDKTKPVNSRIWRTILTQLDTKFEKLERKQSYGRYQNVTWIELTGPVERASNAHLPHRLRHFEAQIGEVELSLTTRASDKMIRSFMEQVDLNGIRHLAGQPVADAPAQMARAEPKPAPVRTGSKPQVTRLTGACGNGTFCEVD